MSDSAQGALTNTATVSTETQELDTENNSSSATVEIVDSAVRFFFSLSAPTTLGGTTYQDEDVVFYDEGEYSMYFDGSDVGLTAAIDALEVFNDGSILLSFAQNLTVPGVPGVVAAADVVRFAPTSTGSTTAGTFAMYFDASDIGLTTTNENIDAIEWFDFVTFQVFYFSTDGAFSTTVPSVTTGQDEDVTGCLVVSTGANTVCGSFAPVIDGADPGVGLAADSEDLNGLSFSSSLLHTYFTTSGNFSVAGLSGANEDVVDCAVDEYGPDTVCSGFSLWFDGSASGLPASVTLTGIDVRRMP